MLEEATFDEINKHLRINLFAMAILVVLLFLNTAQFMREYSLLYGTLIALMLILFVVLAKSRGLLKMRKQALTK